MAKKLTTTQFIEKASIVHNKKYSYAESEYTTNKKNVIITCPIHGNFEQTPARHLLGSGCKQCAIESVKEILRIKNASNTEEFISKANKVHNELYCYDKVEYVNSKTKVTITCHIHGDFTQTPNDHLDGCGCPRCKYANTKTFWSYSDWEKAGKASLEFHNFKLYIIECFNEHERFIKIGKTFQNLNIRFQKGVKMPYEWNVLHVIESDASSVSILEKELHKICSKFHYIPKIRFGGSYECFEPNILDIIKDKLVTNN